MSCKRKRSSETSSKSTSRYSPHTITLEADLSNAITDYGSPIPSTSSSELLPWSTRTSGTSSSPASSEASLERCPLTKRNLSQFNRNKKAMAATRDNKSCKTQTSTSSTSAGVRSMWKYLDLNDMYIDSTAAGIRGADLIEKARAIVTGNRNSAMKKEQAQALRNAREKYLYDNELTLLVDIWSKFSGVEDTGLVRSTVDDQLNDEEEAIRWIEAAWEREHLKCNWNRKFARGSVPPINIRIPALQLMADRLPQMKNPKPDLTYGLLQTAFSADEQYINNKYGAALSLNMDHPFFVVEAGSVEEPMAKAENQCARSGAAMVQLKRKFDDLAEGVYHDNEAQRGEDGDGDHLSDQISYSKEEIPVDHYRTDTKSFAFSLIIRPGLTEIFVHWAEEAFSKEGQLLTINWHASNLTHYFLRNAASWIELHRDIDNVLDWGTLTRKQELKELCNKIFEREQKEKSNKKQKT